VLKVLTCLAIDHDLRLVGFAALICMTSALTAVRLYARSLHGRGRERAPWLVLAGLTGGAGVWSTHFIAMLAYAPSLKVGYDLVGTVLSLVVIVATTTAAFSVNRAAHRGRQALAGVIFGLGVATMHYIGMAAFQPEGRLVWDPAYVASSIALVLVLGVFGMRAVAIRSDWRRILEGGALLVLATCSLHFTAMGALNIVPDSAVPRLALSLSRPEMVVGVGVLTTLVLGAAVGLLVVDVQSRRASYQRMRLLFDANPVAMWLVDSVTFRFLSVNDAAVREFGYDRDRFLELSLYDLLPAEDHEALRVIARDESRPYEASRNWRMLRADGEELVIAPYAQPIPYGKGTAYLAALFNVTDRELANRALIEAKEAAERANRAKSQFVANMSHEIRTPLNGVLGIAGALERTTLNAPQQKMVEVIQSSASTLQRLLDDLLDSSRMERGEITIEERPFDLRRTIVDLAGLYGRSAAEKGVDFRLELQDAPCGAVLGDPERVRQVVGNLLSNAVKFTDAGSVVLTVASAADGRVRFVVEDTGIGFDAAFQARLFKRFEQADASVTRRFGGSGLGLSIAHDLAGRMGGALSARSVAGRGSTFTLELPMRTVQLPATPDQPTACPTAGERRLRVLLADDHPVNRQVVQMMLEPANVELVMVEDGVRAVETFAVEVFDLVLMDMQMPGMDGLEATRRIRALQAAGAPATPIYILSANALPEHVQASQAAGASAHLSKPITLEALYGAIRMVRAQLELAA
jgi:PAS domain S-box-containing protein